MRQRRNTQAQITSYGNVTQNKNCHQDRVKKKSQRKDEDNDSQNIIISDLSENSDNIDAIYDEYQHRQAQIDEPENDLINNIDTNKIDIDSDDELTPEEELEQAIKNPLKREKYIDKYYKFVEYSGNYSYYKCKAMKYIDGIPFKCSYKNRKGRINLEHIHKWEEATNQNELDSEQTQSISEYNLLMTKIMLLLGHFNLSFSVIESQIFWDLLEYVFKLGQKNHKISSETIIKKPCHSKLREQFIKVAKHFHESQINAYSDLSAVALTLDGGTIQYGHFLDYAISSPLFDLKPYLYEADFMANNTTEYIKSKTEEILNDLLKKNIKVKSITGDNYPAQLYALSSWSKTALWKTTNNEEIKKIIFYPCFCHTLQLVADDVENNQQIKDCISIIDKVKKFINNKFSKITGKVPDEVDTRWFSHFNSLKFILRNADSIFNARNEMLKHLETKRDESSANERNELLLNIKEDEFELLFQYSDVMVPIYSATLYFDSNISKAVEIVPIVTQIEKHWETLLCNNAYKSFHQAIQTLLDRLNHRKFHLLDWPLLYLGYSLTPGGRVYARKILTKYGYKINEDKYDNSTGLNPFIRLKFKELGYKVKLNQIITEKNDPMNKEIASIDRNDNLFKVNDDDKEMNSIIKPLPDPSNEQNNLIFMVGKIDPYFKFNVNRSIDDTKLLPFERKMKDLEFQYEPGHFLLLKNTLKSLCKRLGYNDKAEMVIDCYEFWIKSNVKKMDIRHYTKEDQFKIWKDLSLVSKSWKILSEIAIHLFCAQGSETICERKISMQRLAITNRRQMSNEDLVEARFRLSCNKPPLSGIVKSLKSLDIENKNIKKGKIKEMLNILTQNQSF